MQRRRKRLMKLGTKLVELDPARRHMMRIQAKKLRYASEFFGVTFPGKKAARRRIEFETVLAIGAIAIELTERQYLAVERGDENGIFKDLAALVDLGKAESQLTERAARLKIATPFKSAGVHQTQLTPAAGAFT